MTASGLKFWERMMRLSRTTAPHRRRPRRKVPDHEEPAGPKLIPGRGRPRPREESWRHILELVFWTLVVYALWSLWNYGVWGWW
ncbi:MAG: hypothetical protein ACYSX0_09735 [Planctomycetota bacterium]|jgi:hypothetical protein